MAEITSVHPGFGEWGRAARRAPFRRPFPRSRALPAASRPPYGGTGGGGGSGPVRAPPRGGCGGQRRRPGPGTERCLRRARPGLCSRLPGGRGAAAPPPKAERGGGGGAGWGGAVIPHPPPPQQRSAGPQRAEGVGAVGKRRSPAASSARTAPMAAERRRARR